jgi:hypothetical protein
VTGDGYVEVETTVFSGDDVCFLHPLPGFDAGRSLGFVLHDVDSDGILDMVKPDVAAHELLVLRGRGDGCFEPAEAFLSGVVADQIVAADLDANDSLDVIVFGTERIVAALGDGRGGFHQAGEISSPEAVSWVALGDIDGDLLPDALLSTPAGVVAHSGRGNGTFGEPRGIVLDEPHPLRTEIVDLDADGDADLVATIDGATLVLVGRNDGTFVERREPGTTLGAQNSALDTAFGDLDGDGLPEMVVAGNDFRDDSFEILWSEGGGRLSEPETLRLERQTVWRTGNSCCTGGLEAVDGFEVEDGGAASQVEQILA